MAIDTTAKSLIEVKADTSQAVKAIRDLASETSKANTELKKQADASSLIGKKWEELGKSMVGLQLHDTFKKISESVKEATGGVLDLNGAFAGAQAAGPWGAAIGLVGVAVAKTANLMDGLGVSIDELEKKAQKQAIETMPAWAKEIWASREAVVAMNASLFALPGILAQVNAGFGVTYKVLGDARKEMKKYDDDLQKTGRILTLGFGQKVAPAMNRKAAGPESDEARARRLRGMLGDRYTDWTDYGGGGGGGLGSRASENVDELGIQRNPLQDIANQYADNFAAERGSRESRYADFNNAKKTSFLESTFGSIDEFNLYAQGFQMLTGAVGASLTAWIDGSMSAGQALKKFTGEALKGLAVQMSIEALKHGAYALGSLAFGDFRGAAQHGQAALAFGAGAAIAAVSAREFGSGAKAAPSAKAPNVSGAAGGGGTRSPERIYVYGDSFAEDNPRSQQMKAEKIVRRVMGNSAVEAR